MTLWWIEIYYSFKGHHINFTILHCVNCRVISLSGSNGFCISKWFHIEFRAQCRCGITVYPGCTCASTHNKNIQVSKQANDSWLLWPCTLGVFCHSTECATEDCWNVGAYVLRVKDMCACGREEICNGRQKCPNVTPSAEPSNSKGYLIDWLVLFCLPLSSP